MKITEGAHKLPNHWSWIELGQVIYSYKNGYSRRPKTSEQGVIVLRLADVSNGKIDLSNIRRGVMSESELLQYRLHRGDLLFVRVNGSPDFVGRCIEVDIEDKNLAFNDHLIRVRLSNKHVDPSFIRLACTLPYARDYMVRQSATTAGQLTITQDTISALPIPLPPLAEQRRIAAILARTDRLRRLRRYALELSAGYLQAVFVEMFGDLLANSKGWDTCNLDVVSDIASGVTKGQKYNGKVTVEVPYLRVANVQDGYLNLAEIKIIAALPEDIEALKLQTGDIVMTEGGDHDKLGRGAIWHGELDLCIHQNHIFRVRLEREAVLPEYFETFLLTGHTKAYFLQSAKQTTNLATINMTQLKALPVRVPPLPLQERFAAIARRHERLRGQQREALRQAEGLFGALLGRAFRGELGEGAGAEAGLVGLGQQ